MSNPSQSASISSTGQLGGGSDGLPSKRSANGNPNQSAFGGNAASATGPQTSTGPQQEVAGTLPNNYSLGSTKADYKVPTNTVPNDTPAGADGQTTTGGRGGDTLRDGLQNHEVEMPATKPHLQPQSNETSKPPSADPSLLNDDN
ncbi:uncharacterized protein PFL1_05397 [Pseudozyma flocculosa PF-1]|uniref:Uncharacterized protein n=2 Tax=Pseudozyma flocculosa TaxID=84751 RepID=A0A5C3FCG7_9BASI|nr:uncharacterized protein PFL1_05397 [Pseudozyma flocculosa PF-1]EPQ27115.1 hypothetical protein PFL1_05397 [Pseudozyma flocculosa PF-1]SPO41317.1 uncharacterized protein PSFLO_06799 [Pseudozyma flocculosa]